MPLSRSSYRVRCGKSDRIIDTCSVDEWPRLLVTDTKRDRKSVHWSNFRLFCCSFYFRLSLKDRWPGHPDHEYKTIKWHDIATAKKKKRKTHCRRDHILPNHTCDAWVGRRSETTLSANTGCPQIKTIKCENNNCVLTNIENHRWCRLLDSVRMWWCWWQQQRRSIFSLDRLIVHPRSICAKTWTLPYRSYRIVINSNRLHSDHLGDPKLDNASLSACIRVALKIGNWTRKLFNRNFVRSIRRVFRVYSIFFQFFSW